MGRVLEREVEVVQDQRQCKHCHELCEGLAEADPSAAKERTEGERMPLFAVGLQVQRRIRVKAFWDELIWLDPLPRVAMDCLEVDAETNIRVESDASKCHWLAERVRDGTRGWRLKTHCLVPAVPCEVEVLNLVRRQIIDQVATRLFNYRRDFSKKLGLRIGHQSQVAGRVGR